MAYRQFFVSILLLMLFGAITALIIQIVGQDNALTPNMILLIIGLMLFSQLLSILLTVYRERFAKTFNTQNMRQMLREVLCLRYDDLFEDGSINLLEKSAMATNSISGTLRDNLFFNRHWQSDIEARFLNEPVLHSIWQSKNLDSHPRKQSEPV